MANPRRAARPPRTPGQVALSVFKWIGIVAVSLVVLGAAGFAVVYATTPIPNPNEEFETNTTRVFYRDGTQEMGTFAVQNRMSIPLSEMPKQAQDAIIAAENETFWTDPGISASGLVRAVRSALGPGDTIGGSTITQQYVKVRYLSQEKTITRKLAEIVVALKVSRDLTKEQILEGYLNAVYFGRGAYGIQAAAQAYFGIDAKDMDLAQSVALTAIINSPGNLDPAKGEKQAADLLERYQYMLNQMVKTGKLTEAEKEAVYWSLPDFPQLTEDSRFGGTKGFLLRMVQDELVAAGLTDAQINGGGYTIVTTIDMRMQEAAVEAAQDAAYAATNSKGLDPASIHPAIASVDTASGAVLAMYGGPDYVANNRNWATTPRPTGSTFKPWALVAALRQGASLNDTFIGNSYTPKGESVPVTNAGGTNYGPVSLVKATTSSVNSAYVDLVSQLDDGPNAVIQAAEDVGIPNHNWEPTNRIALGYAEVAPLEAARGLATLVNQGQRTTTHIVAEVRDLQGNVIYKPAATPEQAVEQDVARNAVAVLTDVTTSGTGRTVSRLGVDVAGKTGTYYVADVDETRAAWFIGSTAQISTAVMFVAGEQGTGNLDDFSGSFYGSGVPAATWLDYMQVAQEGLPEVRFPNATATSRSGNFSSPPQPSPTATRTSAPEPSAAPSSAEPEEGEGEEDNGDQPTAEPDQTAEPNQPTAGPGGNQTAGPGGNQTAGPGGNQTAGPGDRGNG